MKNSSILSSFPFFLIFAGLLSGCGQNIKAPPVPSSMKAQINAELTDKALYYIDDPNYNIQGCDSVVLARITSVEEYAQQKLRGNSSKRSWYICKTRRISTIQGNFNNEEVNFVFFHLPSGHRKILFGFGNLNYDTKSIPFKKDMIISICLKNGKDKHQILAIRRNSENKP